MLAASRLSGREGLILSENVAKARTELNAVAAQFPRVKVDVTATELSIPGPGGDIPAVHYRPTRRRRAAAGLLPRRRIRRRRPRNARQPVRSDLPRRRRPRAVRRLPAGARAQGARRRRGRLRGISVGVRARRRTGRRRAAGSPSAATAQAATSPRWCRSSRATRACAAPVLQLLLYPMTNFAGQTRSNGLFADGFFLRRWDMDFSDDKYLGGSGIDPTDPRVSPLLADDLSGLPPALLVTAGFDPLRDEGRQYAEALRAAGNAGRLPGVRFVDPRLPELLPPRRRQRDRDSPRSIRLCALIWPAADEPGEPAGTLDPVATKPKKNARYDLNAADRRRNLFIQIGLTAVVVLFAVGLVLYIVMGADKKPTAGEAKSIRVYVEQADHQGGHHRAQGRAVALRGLPVPGVRQLREAVRPDGEQAHRQRCGRRRLLHGLDPGHAGRRDTRRARPTPPTAWPTSRRTRSAASTPRCTRSSPRRASGRSPTTHALIEVARQAGAGGDVPDCINKGRYVEMAQGLAGATQRQLHSDHPHQRRGLQADDARGRWSPRSRRSSATCRAWWRRRPNPEPTPPPRRPARAVTVTADSPAEPATSEARPRRRGAHRQRGVGADRGRCRAGRRADADDREDRDPDQPRLRAVVQHQPGAVLRVGDDHPAGVGVRLPEPADRHRGVHRRAGHRCAGGRQGRAAAVVLGRSGRRHAARCRRSSTG